MAGTKRSDLPRQNKHKKLRPLPKNAKVSKRPLIRPPIPSPYASASTQKVVYVSQKTPFMSAVKRVQKLLRLSEKRLIQSATTLQRQGGHGFRGKKGGSAEADEITEIARLAEKQKAAGRTKKGKGRSGDQDEGNGNEQVYLKGSGKAIQKAMMLGLWFQQRTSEYTVQLRTCTTGTVDTIEIDENDNTRATDRNQLPEDADGDEVMQDAQADHANHSKAATDGDIIKKEEASVIQLQPGLPATRIRHLSVLEVAVSLR
ncbi:hypothetical protein K431DRAFT_300719 [Polychaeton citri CBS 116435]|uniref:Uncharacterized protein n=1 Tax=Polychaeton citri CBS 116435 TaxID=1314669 RepID=A0A9P4QEB6_9PEZI|nr:hypothetical protein K431DRAFT_300719 [Polychaeton citri CBS 116435]